MATARRSLLPREHGAYFQLAIPLLTAGVLHAPTVATCALTAAAALAFLANEPLLVALGHRGPRMLEHDGPRARRRLALLATAALVTGAAGLAAAPRDATIVAVVVAIPVVAVLALAWRRAEHTIVGELIAALALTGASAPVLVAGGTAPGPAVAMWLAWALGFGATVLAVHRVIARHTRPATAIDRVIAAALVAITLACFGLAPRLPALAIPILLVAVAAALVLVPPPATRLRTVGVAIVVAAAGSSTLAWLFGAAAP